jgi:hypothetical protein
MRCAIQAGDQGPVQLRPAQGRANHRSGVSMSLMGVIQPTRVLGTTGSMTHKPFTNMPSMADAAAVM